MNISTFNHGKYILPLSIVFFIFTFSSCKTGQKSVYQKVQTYRIDKRINTADEETIALIEPYKVQLDKVMSSVIGKTSMSLNKSKPESTLGNFVADVILSESRKTSDLKVDFATQNYGGIRIAEIPKGDISVGKVFELMPFENFCVVLEINGAELFKFFEKIAEYGGWPLSSGVQFIISNGIPGEIKINGELLDYERQYHMALPDYIANGGDNCVFFKDKPREDSGKLIRDMIIDHIKNLTENGKEVEVQLEGRIRYKD